MKERKVNIKLILLLLFLVAIIVIVVMCYKIKLHIVLSENGEVSEDYRFSLEFKGSDRYTDEELKDYFFPEGESKNAFLFWYKNTFKDKIEIPFIETYDFEMKSIGKYVITLYDKSVVGYVTYMSNNLYFDKDGVIVESSVTKLENVPLVTGLEFDYFVLHEELPTDNKDIFSLLLDLTQLCDKYTLESDKINITNDDKIQLYLGDIRVDLGDGNMLNEKMMDLNDMYSEFEGLAGVLDMEELDSEGNGYILKKN